MELLLIFQHTLFLDKNQDYLATGGLPLILLDIRAPGSSTRHAALWYNYRKSHWDSHQILTSKSMVSLSLRGSGQVALEPVGFLERTKLFWHPSLGSI
jgi:hypothetical protein